MQDPNQLIYAELDIKNPTSADNKLPAKKVTEKQPIDKTEYAEILYVSPSSTATTVDAKETETKSKEIEIK